MRKVQVSLLVVTLVAGLSMPTLTGCSTRQEPEQRYVSGQIEGEKQKINLEEVQKAFWDTKGTDFNSWMTAFEKRVNEIYEGQGVVSIDATRKTGRLAVTGFIENKKEPGFQPGEEKLFSIEQTGDVTNEQLPYRVSGHNGQPYYEGQHSIFGNPIVQMLVLSHLMGGWGGRYYTPSAQTVVLRDHRDTFRNTPQYSAQRTANKSFDTRYKQRTAGGYSSRTRFGGDSFSSDSRSRRSWPGLSNPTGSSKPSFGWGGRRSGGRSWGGRRR